jgi:mono/diheme cytochrome c family protein
MKNLAAFLALSTVLLASKPKPFSAILPDIPESARRKSNPFANNTDAPIAGRKLFEQHCTACHGKAAEGSRKAPALANDEMRQATQGEIFWILTNGVIRHGMPSWSKLPEPQRWQIVSFIASLNSR